MGAPAAIIGGAAGGIGSLVSGFSGSAQAKAQARQAQQQAGVAASNADAALDTGLTNAQRDYQQGGASMGALRAQMAANGVALDSGSALDVQTALGRTTGQNVGDTMYQANAQAVNYRNQATSYNNEARVQRQQATSSIVGGVVKAGVSGLTTAASLGAFGSGSGSEGSFKPSSTIAASAGRFHPNWGDMVGSGSGDVPLYSTFGGRY